MEEKKWEHELFRAWTRFPIVLCAGEREHVGVGGGPKSDLIHSGKEQLVTSLVEASNMSLLTRYSCDFMLNCLVMKMSFVYQQSFDERLEFDY